MVLRLFGLRVPSFEVITRTIVWLGLGVLAAFSGQKPLEFPSEKQVLDDQIRLCHIPAPPVMEAARGQAMHAACRGGGLSNVRLDRVGNVIGDRPGVASKPHIVV